MLKHAVAISTYATEKKHNKRLEETLRTLRESRYPGEVIVVDDGSEVRGKDYYEQLVKRYLLIVFEKYNNGGISRCKNACINALFRQEIDVGFLVDDDIAFRPKWWKPYLDIHERTNIQHLSWAKDKHYKVVEHQGVRVKKTGHLNGCFLTFTPEVIQVVGGFRVTESRWGLCDHVDWTQRIIKAGLSPFYCDVVGSNDYIKLNRFAGDSTITVGERKQNLDKEFDNKEIYCEVIE